MFYLCGDDPESDEYFLFLFFFLDFLCLCFLFLFFFFFLFFRLFLRPLELLDSVDSVDCVSSRLRLYFRLFHFFLCRSLDEVLVEVLDEVLEELDLYFFFSTLKSISLITIGHGDDGENFLNGQLL